MGTIADKLAKLQETKAALKSAINGSGNTVGDKFSDYPIAVTNGKSLIAAAVTDKGVQTAADATFQTMAENVGKIKTGGGPPSDIDVTISITNESNLELTYDIIYFPDFATSHGSGIIPANGKSTIKTVLYSCIKINNVDLNKAVYVEGNESGCVVGMSEVGQYGEYDFILYTGISGSSYNAFYNTGKAKISKA